MRSIEVQIGHLHKSIMEMLVGTLPSFTENNPRERVQAITLRSSKQLDIPSQMQDPKPNSRQEDKEKPNRRFREGIAKTHISMSNERPQPSKGKKRENANLKMDAVQCITLLLVFVTFSLRANFMHLTTTTIIILITELNFRDGKYGNGF